MDDSRKKFLALKNLALLKREVILFKDIRCCRSRFKKNILDAYQSELSLKAEILGMTETDLEAKVIEILTRFENIYFYLGNETGLATLDPAEIKLHKYIKFDRVIVDENLFNDLSKSPGLMKLVKARLRKPQPLSEKEEKMEVDLLKSLKVTEIYMTKIRGGRIVFRLALKLNFKDHEYKRYFYTVPLKDNSVFSPEFKDKLFEYLELNKTLDKRVRKVATSAIKQSSNYITGLDSFEKIKKMFCHNKDVTISEVRIIGLSVDSLSLSIKYANDHTNDIPFDFISIKNKEKILSMLKKNKVS